MADVFHRLCGRINIPAELFAIYTVLSELSPGLFNLHPENIIFLLSRADSSLIPFCLPLQLFALRKGFIPARCKAEVARGPR